MSQSTEADQAAGGPPASPECSAEGADSPADKRGRSRFRWSQPELQKLILQLQHEHDTLTTLGGAAAAWAELQRRVQARNVALLAAGQPAISLDGADLPKFKKRFQQKAAPGGKKRQRPAPAAAPTAGHPPPAACGGLQQQQPSSSAFQQQQQQQQPSSSSLQQPSGLPPLRLLGEQVGKRAGMPRWDVGGHARH